MTVTIEANGCHDALPLFNFTNSIVISLTNLDRSFKLFPTTFQKLY